MLGVDIHAEAGKTVVRLHITDDNYMTLAYTSEYSEAMTAVLQNAEYLFISALELAESDHRAAGLN